MTENTKHHIWQRFILFALAFVLVCFSTNIPQQLYVKYMLTKKNISIKNIENILEETELEDAEAENAKKDPSSKKMIDYFWLLSESNHILIIRQKRFDNFLHFIPSLTEQDSPPLLPPPELS